MMIHVSLCRIGRSQSLRMRLFLRLGLLPENSPQPPELRTDFGPQPLGRGQVDFEAHLVVLDVEMDRAAPFGKTINVADRRNSLLEGCRQGLGHSPGLRPTDDRNGEPCLATNGSRHGTRRSRKNRLPDEFVIVTALSLLTTLDRLVTVIPTVLVPAWTS